MFKLMPSFALSSLLSLSSFLYAGEYSIDESHSKVGFTIKHMMISNVSGEFKKYNADIIYDEKNKKFTTLTATVDPSSVDTGIEKRDNHLRSPDFFDIKKYPEIMFNMIKHDGDVVEGNLTMHGISKNVKLNLEVGGIAKSPWGDQRFGFSLTGKINRKDFGLNWNKAIESGGFVVDETVKLTIDIEAILLED